MWVTLDQIDNLLAVAESGSITAASERQNKAKSAVYYSIKKLEEQLGFRCVDSEGYRGQLTPQGIQFLELAKRLLKERDDLKESIYRISQGIETRISISASALYPLKEFNKAILKIQKKFPYTEIVFHREILSGEKMLQRGLTDIGLFERGTKAPEFESKLVAEVELYLVLASNHPFLDLPANRQCQEELFKYPQVVQRSTLPDDEDHGVYSDSRRWTVSDLFSKKQIILDGLGWGRLPYHEVSGEIKKNKLVCLSKIENPITIPIHLVRRKLNQHGRVSESLWDLFG